MTGNTANSPMSDINPKSQQLPFLEQSRPSEDYVIVCRAKLRPIHEFFPDIYADQKQYIEAIINHFVYNKIDETSNVSSSFSERLQEQADYSEPSNRSRSSLNNDYKAQISTERKKNIGTLSDSATIAAGERRNDNEWKIAINPINPSTSAANRTKDLTSSAFEESQKKKAPNRIPHDQFSNGCCSRTSSSMNTNSGHLTSSSAESSDHTQPTSELPSPHSSKKSRTVYVDTNVIITVQQLFNDQQQMHESGENIRNHNQRQDLEQKCNVEQLVEKELGKPIKESGKLLEIAIASNITADSSINVGCVKIEKQTLGNDKTGVTFSGTVCRTFTKNAALMHDSNDLQSCYAESHYTTASGTITTTGTSVSFEEHSSQGQNPIVLSARQLEKQPLRSFQQSGFTCEDIPEEYNGEHDERYEWSMSSSASSNSSIPEPTPTQSMQMTGTVEKSLPIREESNSSSHIFDKELMNTPTEAELFKREIQKKLKARENAYAAICRSILCLGTPLSNATSSQVRYYDDDDDGDDNYYDGNEKSKEEEETKNAYEQEQQSGRQQQQRSVNKTARTMTPRSRLSNRTASSSANLSPEEYHLRRRTREKEFMKLLQHQESKQQIWTRAMRQSSLRYWLQDIFVINNSPHQQHRYQQQRQKRMATECQNEEAAI
ncbi:hypothetical protein BDF20DRAFT_35605 [Mycotypha africana]|uniref:uncharacterized protein n=1 Tax=Mycotypha africana TaxID=64632 RepID=UPI002301690B|nr:uncharacterized protein BDF20DRAFT_35605 [Mycotypha africana]KAI8991316.1 hypothetical protein BDF20DRAFT_35605 [Mycotypha africana]